MAIYMAPQHGQAVTRVPDKQPTTDGITLRQQMRY